MKSSLGLGLLAACALLGGCGGGDDTARVSSAGISLEVPDGWDSQENGERGVSLAADEEDLLRGVPNGPRVIAEPATELPATAELLDPGEGDGPPPEEPEELRVGGSSAVAIEIREAQIVRREITVSLSATKAYRILLEAPANAYDAAREDLDDVLASAEFELDEVPESSAETPPASDVPDEEPPPAEQPPPAEEPPPPAEEPPPGDGDAGPSAYSGSVPAEAATAYAVDQYRIRPSEPVLGLYDSTENPDWSLVTFDAGGRQIAVWNLNQGGTWYGMTGTEGGGDAPPGFGIPRDLTTPFFG